jgi:hypothetical protein
MRPRDSRHTYESLLISQGEPPKTISELMGTPQLRSLRISICIR